MSKLGLQASLGKRILLGAIVALVLLIVGFLFATQGGWNHFLRSEPPLDRGEQNAQNASQERQSFSNDMAAWRTDPGKPPMGVPVDRDGYFQPSLDREIPDGEFGEAVRRGREIFMNTGTNAADFVGNDLACTNCHLDAGRRPNAAPMWAAAVKYPAYRSKNEMINTMEDRVHGCFTYSMNAQDSPSGGPPPRGSQIYKDLESYFFWLAQGAPIDTHLPGAGYPELEKTELGTDKQRGEAVFAANCAACHGDEGQGTKDLNGRTIFPPLWGERSFNWGAGMHRTSTAAGFIKANMPLGKPYSLTDQEAWDVAAYITSKDRPIDPRDVDKSQ
jgi:thiosulfate dehydrogenase